ncbi:MAG: hypothetical protein Tsb006_3780 [Rickettsiaceae bacterium]
MKALKLTLAIFMTIWCLGFFYFVRITHDISNYNRSMTDAIVIFGGKKQRLYSGIQLLKLGYAPLAFITGSKSRAEFDNFFKANNLLPEQFIFDTDLAENQLNFAANTVEFLKKYQLLSIRVVVDAPQLPRAMLEISSRVPEGVIVIPHPVSSSSKSYGLMIKEYMKYTITLFASYIGYEDELNLSYS